MDGKFKKSTSFLLHVILIDVIPSGVLPTEGRKNVVEGSADIHRLPNDRRSLDYAKSSLR
jgi:hypothetical protein